jgi:hypothetical protein
MITPSFSKKYAKHNRNVKYNLGNCDVGWFKGKLSFFEIDEERRHLKSLFKELKGANIVEILKVIRLFPRLIDDKMNEDMEAKILKEELKMVLNSF